MVSLPDKMEDKILIAIEGTDGAGKATQTALLCEHLNKLGMNPRQLSFPRYNSDSSALVRMYLNGDFGKHPDDVNAYAASTFYAVDRYASYKDDWGKDYEDGRIIVTDRYTISNAIHQGVKLSEEERPYYLDWLYDLEYSKMGIPKPTVVFFLDVPTDLAVAMRKSRELKTHTNPDIHESDTEYLERCHQSALKIAGYSGWYVVHCATNNGMMRTPEDIHQEIMQHVHSFL